jgi:hypothetical protein
VTVSHATIARLRAKVAEARRASRLLVLCLLEADPEESAEAWQARVGAAERSCAALRAKGFHAGVFVIEETDE